MPSYFYDAGSDLPSLRRSTPRTAVLSGSAFSTAVAARSDGVDDSALEASERHTADSIWLLRPRVRWPKSRNRTWAQEAAVTVTHVVRTAAGTEVQCVVVGSCNH